LNQIILAHKKPAANSRLAQWLGCLVTLTFFLHEKTLSLSEINLSAGIATDAKLTNVSTHFKMIGKIKHIGLTLGLFSTIISFLFFGRQQGTYQILLLSGLLASFIFYLTILFGKETAKSRIIWTVIVVLAATIQWLSEPILIKSSNLIYLNSNDEELTTVNNLLKDKRGDITILNNDITDIENLLTQTEKDDLIKLRQELDVYMITKSEDGIYYGLWGFLDVRLGITYWTKSEAPNENFKHLKSKWYH
jgi:hypothetical protein